MTTTAQSTAQSTAHTTAQTTTRHQGYDDLRAGPTTSAPALLMLPGWCGERTVFDPLTGPLAEDHRVIAADLRGHGGNAHQSEDFDSARQVQDLLDLVEECGLDQVVPVVLSHAGWFAIELRRRLGAERVPGIVLLDWMVLGTPPGFAGALGGLQSPEAWREVRGKLFGMWTSGIESQGVHDAVAVMGRYGFEHWSRAGREISAGFAAHGTPLAALEAMEPSCPTLHLYAQPADDDYLAAQEAFAAEHPWFRVVRLDAHSHFPMFEVPDAMAAEIEEFTCSLV
jgi:pimeloyl-ACP methyl ester carboxylesterase